MAKEFVVGASGGITQVLIGQPFDIIKVRQQTQAGKNALQVARQIYGHEGVLAFYRGTLPPLLGVGACISIVYSTFHTVSQALKAHYSSPSLTPAQTYFVGGVAGLANSVLSGPMEHIRIRLQTQNQNQNQTRSQPLTHPQTSNSGGALACIRTIHNHSGLRGLYRGQVPTMFREFGSYGVWFSVYGYLLSQCTPPPSSSTPSSPSTSPPIKSDQPYKYKVALCGALTGMILWALNYPFDVVKSKMQADGAGPDQKYTSMRDVVRQTWRKDGFNGFFRGVGVTVVRAAPVAGGTFVVVEIVRDFL